MALTLYHYTSKAGKDAIKSSGYIQISEIGNGTDGALFGDGVYLTSMSPSNNPKRREEIYRNNWGVRPTAAIKEKTSFVFEVKIESSNMKKITGTPRDI